MAARLWSLSTSIAGWHGDERTVGSPLNDAELIALRRTRLFGATGTVLMAIGALGVGARPVVQDPTFGVRLLNLPSRIQTVSLTMTTTGAVMMTLAWLMLGRFALGERRMTRSQLDRTLLLWVLPLLIAPPMYSRDVYSYLAQSEIAINGLDPYKVGPATGLGLDHVFTLSVPTMWRETPAPYGPLFLWMGQGISALTGDNIVLAVLCHRLVVLLGVGLIVWATPRLARRCGVAEVSALWLGAANPLLIMHLVAGIHNEALMLGLMLAGTEFALRGVYADSPLLPKPLAWPQSRDDWVRWRPMAMLVLGVVLITHVLTGQAARAAGAGLRRDGAGVSMGRHIQGLPAGRRIADRGFGSRDGGDRLGQRPRVRLAVHPRHRQRGAQLDVVADAVGAGDGTGGHPARVSATTPPRCSA